MADKEKVIKGLECCTQHGSMSGRNCNGHWGYTDASHTRMELIGEYREGCTYGSCETGCVKTLAKDALALLKTQEPDETRLVRHYSRPNVYADLWLHCEKCGGKVDDRYKPKFCPECGRVVKWG